MNATARRLAAALLLGGTVGFSFPALAQSEASDAAQARSVSRAFQRVAAKVEPSVVYITQYRRVMRTDWFGRPIGREGRLQPIGQGSGVIVSPDGYILTNNHVIQGAEQVKVKLQGGIEYDAKVVGRDEQLDVAVVKIEAKELPAAEFDDSDKLEVGEWVVAIGSPFGFSSTVTAGIVSAKGRSLNAPSEDTMFYQDFIQTDAAINPGNSGGPLVNLDGRIVGINSAIATRTGAYEGLGFAIPSNMARAAMENIRANGRVVLGFLGVQMKQAENGQGVEIGEVTPGTPAAAAGIVPGDVIVAYQGRSLDERQLRNAIALTQPGTSVPVEVLRAGKPVSVTVTIADRNQMEAQMQGGEIVSELGVAASKMTPSLETRLRYTDIDGVVVLSVLPQTKASEVRLAPGDVVVAVGTPSTENVEKATHVSTPEELARAMRRPGAKRLFVIRNGRGAYADLAE